MGKFSRAKGARVQGHCARLLRRLWPRARSTGSSQWGGAEVPDVDGTPFWVECKGGKSIGLWAAMRQAEHDRAEAGTPDRPILLYLRLDNRPPVVVQLAEEWVEREAVSNFCRHLLGEDPK